MDIVKSSLWREVDQVITEGEKPVHYTWQATIFAGDEEVKPLRVRSIDVNQDFLSNYADFILLDVVIPLGTYAKRVYPHIGKLEVELKRIRIGEVSSGAKEDEKVQVERYTATMIDTGNPVIEASVGLTTSEEDLNRLEILNVQFQLTDKLLEQVRMIPAGGIYHGMTNEQVVKAVLTKGSLRAQVDDARKLKGVEMVKASNQAVRETTIIPHGTPLVDVPHHIHYHCGGLYATGLGYYLHQDHWYVFPTHDIKRFNDDVPTLTIINIPPTKLPGIERTYRKDGDNLVVVSTGDSVFRDLKDVAQLNQGNGVRFADANRLMGNFAKVADNKAVAARAAQNTEAVGEHRDNALNYVTQGRRKITANPFVEFSALAARQGSGASFVWENANRSLLYPGMPTRVMYLDGTEIKEVFGVLQGVHEYTSLREQGGTSNRFSSSVTLSVFARAQSE